MSRPGGAPAPPGRLAVLVDPLSRDPLQEIALGPAWLRELVDHPDEPVLRFYRPQPTVAFSSRDALHPGINAAAAGARSLGFVPVRRGQGGRAVAYHQGALGFDHLDVEPVGLSRIEHRFREFGELIAGALRAVGVPAEVGSVPGEYCPGDFSVNDGHGHKLVGTAQRLIRGGWLFSASILVTDAVPIRQVLEPVYDALELDWNPGTVGGVEDVAPGVTVHDVRAAVLAAYGDVWNLTTQAELPAQVLQNAAEARNRYLLPVAQ